MVSLDGCDRLNVICIISVVKKPYCMKQIDGCGKNSSKFHKELNKVLGKIVYNSVFPEYILQKKLAMNFIHFFTSKIQDIIDSFDGIYEISMVSLIPDFPLSDMSKFTPVSQEKVEYLVTKLNMTNCKNYAIDVKLLDFEVLGNILNGIFSDIMNKTFASVVPLRK